MTDKKKSANKRTTAAKSWGLQSPTNLRDALSFARVDIDGLQTSKAAVIFSALSVEAFVHDLTYICKMAHDMDSSFGDPKLDVVGDLLTNAKDKYSINVRATIQLIYYIFKGEALNAGAPPFQAYNLLVDLRNKLVHSDPKASELHLNPRNVFVPSEDNEKFCERMISQGAACKSHRDYPAWEVAAKQQQCGIWAYKTAIRMIDYIVNSMPANSVKTHFQREYESFPRVV